MSEQQFEPPFEVISPDNHGAKVIVTGFVLLITTIFVAVIRLITMYVLKRRPGWDDVFFLVATVSEDFETGWFLFTMYAHGSTYDLGICGSPNKCSSTCRG